MCTTKAESADHLSCPESSALRVNTSALYRDSSSWIHICVVVDTTSYIQEDRFKLYVNGVLYQGTYDTASPNWPSINYEYALN